MPLIKAGSVVSRGSEILDCALRVCAANLLIDSREASSINSERLAWNDASEKTENGMETELPGKFHGSEAEAKTSVAFAEVSKHSKATCLLFALIDTLTLRLQVLATRYHHLLRVQID